MKQLKHNGVLVSPSYKGKGLTVKVKGNTMMLTPEQEEMALAWAKKIGTKYVEDVVFVKNFNRDFSKKLGISIKPGDVDYSDVISFIETERIMKENLSREMKKRLASQRKAQRTVNKERYGYAWVDGARVEVANHVTEPSSIFMGRGKHPLRGRWKEGPCNEDVELNLSPDASKPPSHWKAIVWQPDAMWIARWRDKLTGKVKYVWFSESSNLKQRKDIEKFRKAKELLQNLAAVQRHIWKNLNANNIKRRKIATVCFLIEKLKIRVGDEKDPDEADTVGASTLRPEHIQFNGDGAVTFNFLGKDSIPHVFKITLPDNATRNLREFTANARSTLFDGVGSKHVSEFLDEVMSGLSAKAFRTCYASEAVGMKLQKANVRREDPDHWKKYVAAMANLEAAKVCNHKRTIPKTWKSSLAKKKKRLKDLQSRAKEAQTKLILKANEVRERYIDRLSKQEEKLKTMKNRQEARQRKIAERMQQRKPVQALKRLCNLQRNAVTRQEQHLKKMKTKHTEQMKKLRQRLNSRRQRDKAAVDKLKLRIKTQKETCTYNLTTSLKSYIDPRIYYQWGKQVDYDWKRYYPKALQRKFGWVETEEAP